MRALAILLAAIAAAPPLGSIVFAAQRDDSAAIMSKEQWAKIVKRMDETGQVRTLPFKVAEHLGLTNGSETLTVRELAIEREGYQHGIYMSVDPADTRIILAFRTPEKRWTAFVADSGFRLISAIVWNAGESPVAWPREEALPAFTNELGYWSVLADVL
ncbi:MAG TPA: hypothetical protein VGH49_14495 [Xanthobacteraceae bacterium]